ncbi:type III secretion system IpaD/SipD/SspD family effector [Biostraticola tofi]|uniref:Type III secretion system IpaD/SipD/SspD family effector n=2 Tax=Biostraticola tofi TaxID=466109 RepID=A0A4R3YUJ8_9GAMM|nr:type III secretion system IpaD/SipD/SspD family effector [Biostraticola tofi]
MSDLTNQIGMALPAASSALQTHFHDNTINETSLLSFLPAASAADKPIVQTPAQWVVHIAQQIKDKIDSYLSGKTGQAGGIYLQSRMSRGGLVQGAPGERSTLDMASEMEQGLHLLRAQMHAAVSADSLSKAGSLAAGEDSAAAGQPALRFGTGRIDDSWSMAGQEAAINDMKEHYMDEYENIIQRYKEFYQEFSDFISRLTTDIKVTTDSKGNQFITIGLEALNKLRAMLVKFSGEGAGKLYPKAGSTTKENAEKWAAELGLPADSVVKSGDGYIVKMNVAPLETIIKSLEEVVGNKLAMVKYNVFKEGLDGQGDKLKQTMQLLIQKYSNAVSLFDNTVKQYSSIMAKMADLMKLIIQAWS